jgi:choline dehydrogenase
MAHRQHTDGLVNRAERNAEEGILGQMVDGSAFDYVIVGGGSSGCVLANRLSADPSVSVLLLEAGGPGRHPMITMPKGFSRVATDPRMAWSHPTDPQPHRGRPGETWQRGRALGGSSAINGMIYIRGQQQDYADWAARGNPGWGWEEMGRCFREMEDHSLGADATRGVGGPLTVTAGQFRPAFAERMIRAGQELGLPRTEDFNGPRQEGVGYFAHTIRDGRRLSAAWAFLDPVRHRRNLTIITGAEVERVIIEDQRATGVAARTAGGLTAYRARREVMVSAGTLQSPKILQLSGIGNPALLASLGIPVQSPLPAVGRHMRDHVGLGLSFRLHGERGHNHRLRGAGLLASVAEYYLFRRGILATGPFEVGAFVRTDPRRDRPDAQIYMSPLSMAPVRPGQGYIGEVERLPGLTINGYLLRPTSEGEVSIDSADPAAAVRVRPNWLTDPADRAAAVRLIKLIRTLVRQPALADYVGEELVFGSTISTDEEIDAAFFRDARTGNHAVGTCRMGPTDDDVVDARLRVRGVRGLRVADCSIMPTLVSGNTNGPAMAVGWRAAELILQDA